MAQGDLLILHLLASRIHPEGKDTKKHPSPGTGWKHGGLAVGATFFSVLNTQVNRALFPV